MIKSLSPKSIFSDLTSGFVVFLVALPLCLGICFASNAPIFAGILAGVIGGIVVGAISGSSTSVSGPAAGLIAVVATQLDMLGSFDAFLVAIVLAGVLQVIFGISKLGFISAFFPSSVIKGMLAAIGIILIIKQIPLVFGYAEDPLGNDAVFQLTAQSSVVEYIETVFKIHPGTALVGAIALFMLVVWDKLKFLKNSYIPAPIAVITFSILFTFFLKDHGDYFALQVDHFVKVPVAATFKEAVSLVKFPDFSALSQFAVYTAAVTIAIIASLETLLNIEALDKIDPLQRVSPPNRELVAQGVGNICAGMLGGLPVTSVIVRSSVNITMGAKSKLSTISHGFFILGSLLFVPDWLNMIPLSALAAILLITGLKLASPKIFIQMWKQGINQFIPFLATIVAIVATDLLTGVLSGLGIAICFILHSNIKSPIRKVIEKQTSGDEVLHIELPNQVSFFNRASLENTLKSAPIGTHVLIDANHTDYIDPDILDLISDFENKRGKTQKNMVSLRGFKDRYPKLKDHIEYVEVSSKEVQASLTPLKVLEILKEGNLRFRKGVQITRNLNRQLNVSAMGQFPMAVVLSCIDSRSPAELLFDLSIGDIFSVRIAGNVVSPKVLGSMEYGCQVAGAKLILVMGHTSCGAVKAAVDFANLNQRPSAVTKCANLDSLIDDIQKSINLLDCDGFKDWNQSKKTEYYNEVCFKNVMRTIKEIREKSTTLDGLTREKKITIVGAMYDIATGEVSFFQDETCNPQDHSFTSHGIDKNSLWNFFKTLKSSFKTS